MSTYRNKTITANGKNYKLIDALGNGGNGAVWIAEDIETTQQYAVKFLKEQQTEKIARFEKEIAFCQQETHPNIVKIIGQGTFVNGSKNELFYIMPLYEKTLRKVIAEETNPDTLLDYWIKLAKAVEYIHSIHVYHRDIKPENIFVNKSEELVLADFGIAHFHDSNMTKTAAWLGNKSYAAPEQLDKENDNQVSALSDVYALGKILNELLTKNNPAGLSYELIRYSYPQYWQLDIVVEKCLKHNPLDRPACKYLLEEVSQIKKDVNTELEFIEDELLGKLEPDKINKNIIAIANTAAKDIYLARYILQNESLNNIQNNDPEWTYHENIHYTVDNFIKSLYFHKKVLSICEKKFLYESNVYGNGRTYSPLDLKNGHDRKLYDTFFATVTKHHYKDDFLGKTLKYFSSCCDYHCEEILRAINRLDEELLYLNDTPFFYLLYKLRDIFSTTEAKEYNIADSILVNWERTYPED